jgi:hypothetical protein
LSVDTTAPKRAAKRTSLPASLPALDAGPLGEISDDEDAVIIDINFALTR